MPLHLTVPVEELTGKEQWGSRSVESIHYRYTLIDLLGEEDTDERALELTLNLY